jgi:hypothetical protein
MGRPLNKKFFGNPSSPGSQLQVEAWIPGGGGVVTAWIVKQNTNTTYTVTDGSDTGRCKLQAEVPAAEGEMRIAVTPYDGVADVTATGTATVDTGVVTAVVVVDGGSGYSVAPTVTIAGDGTTPPTATATISGGVVTGVVVNGDGTSDFTTATVTFSAPAAGGAVEYVRILNAHQVKTFEENVYSWSDVGPASAAGEATLTLA